PLGPVGIHAHAGRAGIDLSLYQSLRDQGPRRSDDPAARNPSPHVKVSLVTPCRNAERYLTQTIESVLAQRGAELEYFIQDGASTDGTLESIRRYESRLAGWTSAPDQGQADALNKAFARSTGDIVGFLNADGLLLPSALEKGVRAFSETPDVDLVYGEV